MAKKTNGPYKRHRGMSGVGELAGKVLGPHLQKRGFASRDLLTHWGVIAPAPYNKTSIPDRLVWRRGEKGAQGAILFLRCMDAHRLALSYDGQLIAGAINRYFGYVLVDSIKLSIEPFIAGSGKKAQVAVEPSERERAGIEAELAGIKDEKLKDSLRKLGHGLVSKKHK